MVPQELIIIVRWIRCVCVNAASAIVKRHCGHLFVNNCFSPRTHSCMIVCIRVCEYVLVYYYKALFARCAHHTLDQTLLRWVNSWHGFNKIYLSAPADRLKWRNVSIECRPCVYFFILSLVQRGENSKNSSPSPQKIEWRSEM